MKDFDLLQASWRHLRARLWPMLMAAVVVLMPQAAVADDRAARLEAARAYVTLTLKDMDIDEVVRSMYRPILQQMRAQGQVVTPDQEAAIEALYLSNMREPMLAIMRAQDAIFADMLTLAEIEALVAFYSTDEGRQVMQKLPRLIEAQMPMIVEMIETEMETMLPELVRIMGR